MNTQDYYSEPLDDFRGGYQYGRRYTRGVQPGLFYCIMYAYTYYVHTYVHYSDLLCEKSGVTLLVLVCLIGG